MANDMDEAASAFDTIIRGESAPAPAPKGRGGGSDDGGAPEPMFSHLGELEVDEESPPVGGGDGEPNPGEIDVNKPPKKKEEDENLDPDADPDEDVDPDADPDVDPDEDDDDNKGDDPDPDALDMEQEVDIVVDGEPAKVTLKEALQGYIRTETLHRRLNEVKEDEEIITRAAANVSQNFDFSLQTIEAISGLIEKLIPPEPEDWDAEFKANPQTARGKQKFYEGVRGHLAEFEKQKKAVIEAQKKQDMEQTMAFAQKGRAHFERMHAKDWASNPKQRDKDKTSMIKTAKTVGFEDAEIAGVFDPRMLEILYKASKYDRMMAARPKPVNNGSKKPAISGSGNKSRTGQRGLDRAMSALSKSGNVHDAAPVFDRIINRR